LFALSDAFETIGSGCRACDRYRPTTVLCIKLRVETPGLKTRKEAMDHALSQAERAAQIAKLFARSHRSKDELKDLASSEPSKARRFAYKLFARTNAPPGCMINSG
jgi:hypothetical protein